MKVFLPFVIFYLLSSQIYSQAALKTEIDSGLIAAYSFDFEKAENIFLSLINENPDHPAGYLYMSQIYLWKFMGSNDPGNKGIFLKYAGLAVEKGKELISENESADNYFYLGTAYQFKAIELMYEGEFFDAYSDVSDAVGNLEDCLELDPEYYDAYLGLGIFNFTLSYVPSFYRFIIGILGLSSDKENGFRQIQTSAANGKINKYEAEFYYARLLTDYTAQYNASIKILKNLVERFPKNVILLYQYSLTLLLNRDINKSEVFLNRIIESANTEFQQTNSFAYLRMGDIEFRRNNFESAQSYYENFLNITRSFEFSGYAYFQIALCEAFIGDEMEVKHNLILARNGNLEVPEDKYAKLKSEFYYADGFSDQYLELCRTENLIYMKKYAAADSILNKIITSQNFGKGLEAKADFLKAKILFFRSEFQMSIKFAEKIGSGNLNIEKWILPASKLLIAESYFRINLLSKAEEYLELAEDENQYENLELLNSKINNLKIRIAGKAEL